MSHRWVLSPLLVEEMFDLIKRIRAENISILLVEQNVAQALEVADKAYVLENGTIRFEGGPQRAPSQRCASSSLLGACSVRVMSHQKKAPSNARSKTDCRKQAGRDSVEVGEIVNCGVDLAMFHDSSGPPTFETDARRTGRIGLG